MSWDIQELFLRHAKGIAKSLRKRGINEETAADITQDTFLRVLASPPTTSQGNHNPRAYLYQVSRNLSIDYLRRESLLVRTDLSDADFASIADPSPSAETIVYDRQRLALVKAALDELPDPMRKAFELHRMGELPITKVATHLGMSTTRTWALIRDAYEHVEDRLNGL